MQQDILLWVISGLSGFMLMLLSVMYAELKQIRESINKNNIDNAVQTLEIDTLKKVIYDVPCLNDLKCYSRRT